MYIITMERTVDPDYIYHREDYTKARHLANSQQKEYVDKVTIYNNETGQIVYFKVVNEDRSAWTVLIDVKEEDQDRA